MALLSVAVILLLVMAGLASIAIVQWRKTRDALRRVSGLLDEVEQEARIGNWEIDLKTREIRWSREMFRLLDLDPETVKPSFEQWMVRFHPQDRDACLKGFRRVEQDREPFELDARMLNAAGYSVWTRIRARVKDDPERGASYLAGTIMDVSSRKAQEELIRDYSVVFEAKMLELAQLNEEFDAMLIGERVAQAQAAHSNGKSG